jgi:hypothetical protein
MIAKIVAMCDVPIGNFPFAKSLLGDDFDHSVGVRDYVRGQERFRSCCESLSLAMLMSNPIDALFYVYLTLKEIRQTGVGLMKTLPEGGLEESLSFDDTLSLFF